MLVWMLVLVMGGLAGWLMHWRRTGLELPDYLILFGSRVYGLLHRWRSRGFTNLPAQGPALIIANHTCSADPPFLLGGSRRLLSFLVAREHFDVHPIATSILTRMECVKVTRNGRDAGSLRGALRCLAAGRPLTIFPEGNLSGVRKNRLLTGKPGVAWLALVTRAPVYPVYIAGGPRTERLLYSWLVPCRNPVRVFFGKPIDLSAYYHRPRNRQVLEEVMAYLMRHIAQLDPKLARRRSAP